MLKMPRNGCGLYCFLSYKWDLGPLEPPKSVTAMGIYHDTYNYWYKRYYHIRYNLLEM